MIIAFYVLRKKYFVSQVIENIIQYFSRSFIVLAFLFSSEIHLKLDFKYEATYEAKLLPHITILLFQRRLLKRHFYPHWIDLESVKLHNESMTLFLGSPIYSSDLSILISTAYSTYIHYQM